VSPRYLDRVLINAKRLFLPQPTAYGVLLDSLGIAGHEYRIVLSGFSLRIELAVAPCHKAVTGFSFHRGERERPLTAPRICLF